MLEDRARARGRELRPEAVEPGTWLVASGGAAKDAPAYVRALKTIHATGRKLARFLERYDVLLTPTLATPPVALGRLFEPSLPAGRDIEPGGGRPPGQRSPGGR